MEELKDKEGELMFRFTYEKKISADLKSNDESTEYEEFIIQARGAFTSENLDFLIDKLQKAKDRLGTL